MSGYDKTKWKLHPMSDNSWTGTASLAKQKGLDEKDVDKVHKSKNPYQKKSKR